MKLFVHSETHPACNIALEEYLLHHVEGECMMLWSSGSSVVIGKHQNALAEVNFPHIYKKGIPVIRRLSGGGTVFHGPGNLNYTMIMEGETGNMVNFRKHTAPVIDFLNELGVPARFEGKNDIRVNGLKISGNAEHVYKQKVLHHGTLLYDADLTVLSEAIRERPDRYSDRGVKSVRSQVGNISEFFESPPSFHQFAAQLKAYLKQRFNPVHEETLVPSAIPEVTALMKSKYDRWTWNYGYSPSYTFSGQSTKDGVRLFCKLEVKEGIIRHAVVNGASHSNSWKAFEQDLPGNFHEPSILLHLLQRHDMVPGTADVMPDHFLELLF